MSVLADCHVLIVEDDPDTADLHTFVLRGAGADVTTVPTAEEALAILRGQRVDVLVADLSIPDVDGFELLARARQVKPELVAVAVTGYSDRDVRTRAIEAGFLDYLTKPLQPRDLLKATQRGCAAAA